MAATSQFSIAVHILTIIAKSGAERVKSACIARSVNTNPVVIRRLLSNLRESGLVIYKAVSCGEVFALHTNKPDENCPIGKNIEAVLCGLQKEIDKSIEDKLNQYTLRDIIEKIEDIGKIT